MPLNTEKKRVLVIEDNPDDWEIAKRLLAERYDLARAAMLREALEILRFTPFDAILADLMLPDSDGRDVLPRLKRAAPHITVIAWSGRKEPEFINAVIMGTASNYIVKGWRADLPEQIAIAIDNHRAHLAIRRAEQTLSESRI